MLTATNRKRDGVVIIDLEGKIDGSSECQQVLGTIKECLDQKPAYLLLNLEGVDWINSLGVGYLVAAFVSARNQGTSLRLFGVGGRTGAILHTCGVAPSIIAIFNTEEEALQG